MNTTTKPAPARPAMRLRTTVRAGYSFGATQTGSGVTAPRPRAFGDVMVGGDV